MLLLLLIKRLREISAGTRVDTLCLALELLQPRQLIRDFCKKLTVSCQDMSTECT